MPSFAKQHALFRAYDIRGSRRHFTPNFMHALGCAFADLYGSVPHHAAGTTIVIGYDVRHGSQTLAQRLADHLVDFGLQVVRLGLVTTPMMVFWAEQHQGHGIMVTASHSGKDILGVKWLINHHSPSSTDIQRLYQQLRTAGRLISDVPKCAPTLPAQDIRLSAEQVASHYIKAIARVFAGRYPSGKSNTKDSTLPFDKLKYRVVIDCMHGATSAIVARLFGYFCQHIILMNDRPDGSFPTGNPDPTEPNRLAQLQQNVIANNADIGLAFDGDGDRLMIVDGHGAVVSPDHLLYLLAQVAISERPEALRDAYAQQVPQVLFDIKCSHHLPALLSTLGAAPIMSRTGSSFMRQRMQHSNHQILFAGELSGHFIFNDGRFIVYDDALYAALRLLHWLADSTIEGQRSVADITQRLPTMISTADHYLPMPQTQAKDEVIVEQLAKFCHYLRQLVAAGVAKEAKNHSMATCPSSRQHPSSTAAMAPKQAGHLLPIGTKISCIDGVRLDFAHGFGVLRQSNTSRHLTARFAGDSIEDLRDIQARFAALCRPFDQRLAAQIVAIPAG